MDRGILKLERFLRSHQEGNASIGRTYAPAERRALVAEHEMSATARAALAGVTACLATMALVITVALLATADMHPAAAHPLIMHAIVA